ncbi:MAG: hypothetical protein WA240_08255 [Nitrospirota bacterium]
MMDKFGEMILDVPRFRSFPRNLEEVREFINVKGLNSERIDDETLKEIVEKINGKQTLTPQEISAIHSVVDLGDTCGCDSDHRMRGEAVDGKSIGYSTT